MATTHRIAPHAAATGKELVAGLAVKVERLRADAALAAKSFNLTEAVAAGGYAAIALYSLALIVNFALVY